jgi:hypothetical protein
MARGRQALIARNCHAINFGADFVDTILPALIEDKNV